MAHISKYAASVTTTTGLTGEGYTENISGGYVVAVLYDGTISSTADLTISGANSGQDILISTTVGSSGMRYLAEDTILNSTGGSISSQMVKIPVANERIKVAVAASSAALLTGTFTFYIEGA